MALIIIIFLTALAISSVAAYFSLVGLGSIFTATFWGVVIMAGTLEVGKIVTTKWLHTNWRNPAAPWYFRGLLCIFVASLMMITSAGIYGYLTRGHLEQQAPLAGLGIQVAQLETQLKQKQDENIRLEGRLGQISKITDKVLEGNARAGLRASNQSKKEAAAIQKSIEVNNQAINDITNKLVPLKVKTGNVEGELGVARFIAEAFGWPPEKAIRIITALIMIAFDPLALSLFIMGGISLKDWQEKRKTNAAPVNSTSIVNDLLESSESIVPVEEGENRFIGKAGDFKIIKSGNGSPLLAERQSRMESSLNRSDEIVEEPAIENTDNPNEAEPVIAVSQSEFDNLALEISKLEASNAELLAKEDQLRIEEAQLRERIAEFEEKALDNRPPKQQILDMLEASPEVLQEIIEVVETAKNSNDSN